VANTWTRIPFRAVRNLCGPGLPSIELPEGATQTFKAGAPVVFVAGYIAECGADPVMVTGLATKDGQNKAVGVAKQDIILAHSATLFLGNLEGVSAAADRGASFGLAKDATSGKWYVDKADTTAKRVTVWEVWEQAMDAKTPAWGDTLTPVVFSFAAPYCSITAVA
jgi:enamine deaminase RidA (YjgF/YER057c/UK114 family)